MFCSSCSSCRTVTPCIVSLGGLLKFVSQPASLIKRVQFVIDYNNKALFYWIWFLVNCWVLIWLCWPARLCFLRLVELECCICCQSMPKQLGVQEWQQIASKIVLQCLEQHAPTARLVWCCSHLIEHILPAHLWCYPSILIW